MGFQLRFRPLYSLLDWFTLIPGLIGVLLAAPFILELENGTYRLAWTQSITRRRWIATKLAVPIVAALLIAAALILLTTWWRAPFVHLNGRMETGTYDSEGTVVFGYTLFALALALAIGVIWRRAIAAVTLAFVGYFAARIFVDTWLRTRLVAPVEATWHTAAGQPANLDHANIISQTGSGPGVVVGNGSGPARNPRPRCRRRRAHHHARRLPAGERLLAAPGTRDRALRRRGAHPDRLRSLVDAPTHNVRSSA